MTSAGHTFSLQLKSSVRQMYCIEVEHLHLWFMSFSWLHRQSRKFLGSSLKKKIFKELKFSPWVFPLKDWPLSHMAINQQEKWIWRSFFSPYSFNRNWRQTEYIKITQKINTDTVPWYMLLFSQKGHPENLLVWRGPLRCAGDSPMFTVPCKGASLLSFWMQKRSKSLSLTGY